jgi:hypothetical protein
MCQLRDGSRTYRHGAIYCTATSESQPWPASSKLLAWIEASDGREFQAAVVAAMASRRKPATNRCAFLHEARRWVEVQAAEFGVPVEWVDQPPPPAS